MNTVKTTETTYIGPDSDQALKIAFPNLHFTKQCACEDKSILVWQEFGSTEEGIGFPKSLTVSCLNCRTAYSAEA